MAAVSTVLFDQSDASRAEHNSAAAIASRASTGPQESPVLQSAGSVVFENLSKIYTSSAGPVHALKDISVTVPSGSIFGIIGRSGAGKSSLLRTINRLERPTDGRVLVDGDDIAGFTDDQLVGLRRRVGMIFQHFNLLSAKTVWGNVALALLVAGVERNEINQRVADVLKLVGLEGKETTYPSRLSGGQKQRVGIARALVSKPEILLCDEATSALDPETTLSILRLLQDINQRLKLTIVLITHEMSVIREICDQVLVLEQGEIAEQGPVWQIFGKPSHPSTKALLEPLQRGLLVDLASRLEVGGDGRAVVELSYTGEGGLEPDLGSISAVFGPGSRLIQSNLDRIQGHVQGQVLITAANPPDISSPSVQALAHSVRILGYVTADV
ncbi:ATP-binding cassette domain-containing protein (plasmid) [Agrobacterium vitis]|uniref:methionine ABC transporter ATP-binding protein n=1 Tax=Agrobacterium vitis TaxID=373 RepID=UPI0012E719AC|nr:ATP-binding cassette domain-containing protein [Agrobacterium vitis]MVA25080.1 ATP-binding cassette domain-containing protein [Agrobacterium vitis]